MDLVPVIVAIVKIALLIGGLMTAAAYLVLLERWMAAWIQDRKGPNRVGIPLTKIKAFGLGQPLADGLKFIFKEDYTPKHVDKALFALAPIVILASALAIFAVIPFGSSIPAFSLFGHEFKGDLVNLLVAPSVDVGLIYVFALSSIAVYGVILGGWASNNKYSFLGGLRSSAQLIAYEIPMGLGILGIILCTGSLKLDNIIQQQADTGWWNAFTQPLGFIVFTVAAFAEAARLPFDLPEAEQELIGGYHTEYAGMKLISFLIAEFLHMITASFLIVILFLGGWHLWGVTELAEGQDMTWVMALIRIVVFVSKFMLVVLFFMIVRWSWPRFRFDQLMSLAWKVMLPLGLLNLAVMACLVEAEQAKIIEKGNNGMWMIVGFVTLIVGWMGSAMFSPLAPDNTPRKGPAGLLEPERQLG